MDFRGKRALILGIANQHSIAYGIAKALHEQGVELIFSYAGPMLAKRVFPIAEELGAKLCVECDVSKDYSIQKLMDQVRAHWDGIDMIVHSVAYAPTDELNKAFHLTSRQGFCTAMDISVYSLVAVIREAGELLAPGASVITLSYYGAQKVVPNYGVMGVAKAALEASVRYLAFSLGEQGVRVNAISAGPLRTLSAAAISGLSQIQRRIEKSAPLGRNIDPEDVAKTALYLLSDLSSGVTGEVIFVDAGMNIMAY
ncbi:MAG: enoyl-ACP reductase [Candidatus Cloacimonetes bacterium]|nr:enoyl-ACP reductase [Candidatus Cloacimonadota bacterium]HNZ06553.1 enoyl-ACP reductase [Candidatus Cloacimonadota bacterium]HPN40520.1 enoyl-ACP reductase [Candidatus Cloacimonadota bacterium]